MMVTTSRDKKLRVWDVRQERPAHEVAGHTGAKNSRAVWMGEHNRIATTGFSKMSDRQMALWDVGNPSEPIGGFTVLDSISGVCMPFWDDGTNCLYLAGKGDGNIRYFEYENDKFEFLSEYKSGDPQRGLAFMPRRGLDVHENEVMRAFKTVNDTYIEPISFVVPRRAEVFQADIFPPAIGTRPGVTAKEWLAGETRVPAKIDLEAVYEGTAPKEVPTDFHPPKEAPPANAAQVKHTAPVAAKREEPVATPTLQKAPVSVAEQKGSISAMASKFQDKEAEESEDDESESSFEEISRPAPRQSAPAQVASAVAKTGAAVVNAAKSAAQPLAAASPLPTKTTSAPSPKPAAAPISSPVSSPAPSSSTIPPSLESSLEQIKTLLQQQTSIISAQSDKIALLTAEVETLKQRVAGTSLETDRKMDELKEVVKVEIKEGVEGVMKVVS
jgi:coronin-1B/1C/6